MKCPVCSTELRMMERQGVEIDYCPNCRGVWLDRGELDKVIERSAASEMRPTEREYERPHFRGDGNDREYRHDPKHKRKKSFLGDLFDF